MTGAGRYDLERALDRASGARAIPGNRLTLLSDGPGIFAAVDDLIESAQRTVHFENYIIRSDATGWAVGRALARRARDGVSVRVLFDAVGSRSTSRRLWRFLREHGVEVRRFRPLLGSKPLQVIQRDHRKLVAVDAREALVGGFCIGDEWARGSRDEGNVPWRDAAVRIEGPAAHAADLGFRHMWGLAGPPLDAPAGSAEVPDAGETVVRVIEGAPGRSRIYRALSVLAAGAASRLWIADAYFVPPPTFIAGLVAAASDRVVVRVLVPGKTDLPVVRLFTRAGYRDLLEGGLRIYEWQGPMLHAKTALIDRIWSRVGSSNINVSSLLGNYELDVLAEGADLAGEMAGEFRRDLSEASEVVLERRWLLPRARREDRGRGLAAPPPAGRVRAARRAAAVTLRQIAAGARRRLTGVTALVLTGMGVFFLALPRFTAWLLAGGAFSLAGVAAWHGFRRRRETRP